MSTRILFYNHAAEVSGAERGLLAIMTRAQLAGHAVTLCAPDGPLTRAAGRAGIAVQAIPPLELGYTRNPLVLARYLARATQPLCGLVGAIRRSRPDIVHANSIRSGLLAAAAVRCVRPRPRLVVHMRDAWQDEILDLLAAGIITRDADAAIAISHFVAQRLRSLGGTVHVLHNAIDPDGYRRDGAAGARFRAQHGLPADAPLLAVVAQLTPWKGQLDALEAFAHVRRAHPRAHLVIAGAAKFTGRHRRYDTSAFRDALVARARRPDLAGRVHFLGDVADVAALYAALDLLVVPSWAEPFGRVVIEALAAECAVVATAAGGIPEILTHGGDGWLVAPRDPAALAQGITTLLGDPALRTRLARAGRHTVCRRFALSDYAAKLGGIQRAVLAGVGRAQDP
jgi:glycosyltransferase involved in cell wall biosynthesis